MWYAVDNIMKMHKLIATFRTDPILKSRTEYKCVVNSPAGLFSIQVFLNLELLSSSQTSPYDTVYLLLSHLFLLPLPPPSLSFSAPHKHTFCLPFPCLLFLASGRMVYNIVLLLWCPIWHREMANFECEPISRKGRDNL